MIVRVLYNVIAPIVLVCMLPSFVRRMIKRGGYRHSTQHRLGLYSEEIKRELASQRRIWIHAVSVGEMYVAKTVIDTVRKNQKNISFVITTTTSTGYRIAHQEKQEDDVVLYFPLDLPLVIKRVVTCIKPIELILIEGECWPNLIWEMARRRIPIALVNGRVSDKSYRKYRRASWLTKEVYQCVDRFYMQQAKDAERIINLGANPHQVFVSGNLKFDFPSFKSKKSLNDFFGRAKGKDQIIILASSTWPGEEMVLARTAKKLKFEYASLQLIIAPRHVERIPEIKKKLSEINCDVSLRSEEGVAEENSVWLLDSTGELSDLYPSADIVFIGKSLCAMGGQNPIEAASHGCVLITGPHMKNFNAEAKSLDKFKARIIVDSERALEDEIKKLLSNSDYRSDMSQASKEMFQAGRGGIQKTLEGLAEFKIGSFS